MLRSPKLGVWWLREMPGSREGFLEEVSYTGHLEDGVSGWEDHCSS